MEYTYLELKHSIVNALSNFYSSRLRELSQDGRFEEIIKELETEMDITIKRFWEN